MKKQTNENQRPTNKVGALLTLPAPTLQVLSSFGDCDGCYFYDGQQCTRTKEEFEIVGGCGPQTRSDGRHVIFSRVPGLTSEQLFNVSTFLGFP